MKVELEGAVGTVTGSRSLVRSRGRTVLVDCGLYQGEKELRLLNRAPFGFDPAGLDAVVLTHAHVDHSGLVPRLVKEGFGGSVHCTRGTASLCSVLLPDSGALQEEEARLARKGGWSKHAEPTPVYTRREAEAALARFRPAAFGEPVDLGGGLSVTFRPAAHIPGAASLVLDDGDGRVLFSGDVGRQHRIVGRPPAPPAEADLFVVESTYGDRVHPREDPYDLLADVVNRTVDRGGVVIVPSFAVGRAQVLMYMLHRLRKDGRIPGVPVWVDSPMAAHATNIARRHCEELGVPPAVADEVIDSTRVTSGPEESQALDERPVPMVLISASGMATGGRVLHHIKALGTSPRNTLLFVGFQAPGTRGRDLLEGKAYVKIHGDTVHVRAEVARIDGLSAHADRPELLRWLGQCPSPPSLVLVNHGEPPATEALVGAIRDELGWPAEAARSGEERQVGTGGDA